jgi:hypothetical protein
MSKLLINQKYQLGQQEKQVNAVTTTPYRPKHSTKRNQKGRCLTCGIQHKGACLIEKGKVPSHWSKKAQERMRKRIQKYKEKHKDAKPIATPIKVNKDHKKRKDNEQEPICTLITLSSQPIKEIPIANTIEEIPMVNVSEYESNEYEQDKDLNHQITNWFLDSGANAHFCNDRTAFIKYKPICEKHNIAKVTGSNQHLLIMGIGTVDITLKSIYGTRLLRVTNVYYSPLIRINVLSLSRFFEISEIWGEWRKAITLYTNDGTPFGAAEYNSNGL